MISVWLSDAVSNGALCRVTMCIVTAQLHRMSVWSVLIPFPVFPTLISHPLTSILSRGTWQSAYSMWSALDFTGCDVCMWHVGYVSSRKPLADPARSVFHVQNQLGFLIKPKEGPVSGRCIHNKPWGSGLWDAGSWSPTAAACSDSGTPPWWPRKQRVSQRRNVIFRVRRCWVWRKSQESWNRAGLKKHIIDSQ